MGKIKKILENNLRGGVTQTDVYPITSTKAVYDENNTRLDVLLSNKLDKEVLKQSLGDSEEYIVSQKTITENLSEISDISESAYKTLNIGSGGLVTLSPVTSYFTYKITILQSTVLNIDLQRMISQVGNARCRLIIDLPTIVPIYITKPVLWGGTIPSFSTEGQYIFEIINTDEGGTPLIWQVASTTKTQTTGVILYVDSTDSTYSTAQINGEVATRTTSTWENPFKYLQNAINEAQAGDIIFIKTGTYKPTHLSTSPTVYYTDNYLDRNATFTIKNGVDLYGGFIGTENKTWQRQLNEKGFSLNQTILSGDIRNEAIEDSATLIGDTRTVGSRSNACYNVITAGSISDYTYIDGVTIKYGNANGPTSNTQSGAGLYTNSNLVVKNSKFVNNYASNKGAAVYQGICLNCEFKNNTSYYESIIFKSKTVKTIALFNNSISLHSIYYGGNHYQDLAGSNIGTAFYVSGSDSLDTINCIALNNFKDVYSGSAFYRGNNINATIINNVGNSPIYIDNVYSSRFINCLIFNNKLTNGNVSSIASKSVQDNTTILNCAYDFSNPVITGTSGSEIDFTTCLQNITLGQIEITLPTIIGLVESTQQKIIFEEYINTIYIQLKPSNNSILKNKGVKRTGNYATPIIDFNNNQRNITPTIGALE